MHLCCRRHRRFTAPRRCWANPIELNSRLGTYTNFVNLLDLCGLAVPASMRSDGGQTASLCLRPPAAGCASCPSLAAHFPCRHGIGDGQQQLPPQPPLAAPAATAASNEIAIAVVGAHLSGMPLNGELTSLGGRLLEASKTAPLCCSNRFNMHASAKPGMLRVEAGAGAAIELELWALSAEAFGKFVAAIPPPLSIGTVRLADGRSVKGFIVEAADVTLARDISSFRGWRAYAAGLTAAAPR